MRTRVNQELWTHVDQYIETQLVESDSALDAALKASSEAGLPAIQVSPAQGKMLQLLARAIGARRILELGTLGAYSTIWMARALSPGGRLVTLEADPKHASVARGNIARAGLEGVVEIRLGLALESLQQLADQGAGPFDLIFIDADKGGYPEYFKWAVKLSRPGTVIIADNVVRKGAVVDTGNADPNIQGIRRFNEAVKAEPRVSATAIQTVGNKGYDGFALIFVLK